MDEGVVPEWLQEEINDIYNNQIPFVVKRYYKMWLIYKQYKLFPWQQLGQTEPMHDHLLMLKQFDEMYNLRKNRLKDWHARREERDAKKKMFKSPPHPRMEKILGKKVITSRV